MGSVIIRLKEILAFYRVKDWLHLLGLIFLGEAYTPGHLSFSQFILVLAIGCCYLAHGYSLNDIFDGNLKVNISRSQAVLLSLCMLFLSLVLAVFVSWPVFAAVAFAHICGMFYSARPFRYKNKLFGDMVFNSFSLSPLFLLGYLPANGPRAGGIAMFFLLFVYFLPIQLIHEINDSQEDRSLLQTNSFQKLGLEMTNRLISAFFLGFAVLNLIFWQLSFLTRLSALIGVVFSLTMLIMGKKLPLPSQEGHRQIKIRARLVSVIYGLMLLASFYRERFHAA